MTLALARARFKYTRELIEACEGFDRYHFILSARACTGEVKKKVWGYVLR